MKKALSIVAILLCAICLCACEVNSEKPSTKVEEVKAKHFSMVDLTQVTEDLQLYTEINGVKITYSSSNVSVVSNQGKVTRQEEDTTVELTVTYSLDGYSSSQVFQVTVLKKESDYLQASISEIKKLSDEAQVKVVGIVAKIINGTEKNVPVAFYLVDQTDGIYVYAPWLETMPQVGDQVEVTGNYVSFIAEADTSSAQTVGYKGSRQISLTEIQIISTNNQVDFGFATENTIYNITKTAVTEVITSNLYCITAKVRKSQGNGFVNYYFDDLNGTSTLYAYTTANGKDLSWLEEYDGTVRKCYLVVINAKLSASGSFWRLIPIAVGEEVEVSDQQYMGYALERALNQFQSQYQVCCQFDLANKDSILDATFLYQSKSDGLTIVEDENCYKASISYSEPCEMTVEVTVNYNGKTAKETLTFKCTLEKVQVETTPINLARQLSKDQEVTIEGIIAGFLYLSGTSKPAGFELVDQTSSIAVFVSTAVDTQTDITKLSVGEYLIVTGNYDLYQPRSDYQHNGSVRIKNAEVLYHDYENHDLPEGVIQTVDFATLYANPSDNNITNIAYYTNIYVERSTGSYVNYYIHDLEDPSKSMIVYSQNSGSNGPAEYNWLKDYAGKCVKAMVTLRIGALSSGAFIWKAGVLQVVEVVKTPASIAMYCAENQIKGLFGSEYLQSATVSYTDPEGLEATFTCSSSQVTVTKEDKVSTITINQPTLSESATLTVKLVADGEVKTFDITLTLTKASVMSLSEFRETATKNGSTVIVEGVVFHVLKLSDTETSSQFFITDGTSTIFCKTKAPVKVGDKVNIQGKMDLYYGLPQISANATVTIISSGNQVSTTAFHNNATIDDLVDANTAGEDGRIGAEVYVDVVATIHVSSSRVYISVGEKEIDMYYYTSAKYYAVAYAPLEALDGTQVKLTLVAYNWYNSQYTYAIVSCEAL